jgi:hypothetical protein
MSTTIRHYLLRAWSAPEITPFPSKSFQPRRCHHPHGAPPARPGPDRPGLDSDDRHANAGVLDRRHRGAIRPVVGDELVDVGQFADPRERDVAEL